MTGLNFEYLRARMASEAVRQFQSAKDKGLTPMYLAGGTEIITLGRLHQVNPDVVIDLKPIPAMHGISLHDGVIGIPAAVTLTEITDSPAILEEFPLLAVTVREIADRTARNKITLGGNLCGQIFYREAILPLLLCDTILCIAKTHGPSAPLGSAGKGAGSGSFQTGDIPPPHHDRIYEVELLNVFRRAIHLSPGEFIVSTRTPQAARRAPFFHEKRRKAGHVGYPIVTVAAVRVRGKIRAAFSGVCAFPFRSSAIERELNRVGVASHDRVRNAVRVIPVGEVLDDYEASRAYRLAVLQDVLSNALGELGE